MRITHESLMRYQGLNGADGVCHVRVFERPGELPVVIAGNLDDNPGTTITNAIEMVAEAVKRNVISDGREFKLIEHYPGALLDPTVPAFSWVTFEHQDNSESNKRAGTVVLVDPDGNAVEYGREIEGDFRNPRWKTIDDITQELSCEIATWKEGRYTSYAVGGKRGKKLRDNTAKDAKAAIDRLICMVEGSS
jgi:hypothetical protein